MSAIGASLAGAAIFAVAAIWLSLQGWLARRSPAFKSSGDTSKMLTAGIIGSGVCLIATSVAVAAGIGLGLASLLALVIVPLTSIAIWRSVDLAGPFGADRTGGVATARRVLDLGQHQNLRAA